MTHEYSIQLDAFDGRKVFFFAALAVLASSFLLYVYLLNTTIVQVVQRKTAETNISKTTMHISELESDYLRLSTNITPALAKSMGFIEPKGVTFASRDASRGFAGLRE